jgi:hypothetical protein
MFEGRDRKYRYGRGYGTKKYGKRTHTEIEKIVQF